MRFSFAATSWSPFGRRQGIRFFLDEGVDSSLAATDPLIFQRN
jgi:hypothetical protein